MDEDGLGEDGPAGGTGKQEAKPRRLREGPLRNSGTLLGFMVVLLDRLLILKQRRLGAAPASGSQQQSIFCQLGLI